MNRIIMDISDHTQQVIVVFHQLTPERPLEKAAVAAVFFVDIFCICIEKVGKMIDRISLFSSHPDAVRSFGRRRIYRLPFHLLKPDSIPR